MTNLSTDRRESIETWVADLLAVGKLQARDEWNSFRVHRTDIMLDCKRLSVSKTIWKSEAICWRRGRKRLMWLERARVNSTIPETWWKGGQWRRLTTLTRMTTWNGKGMRTICQKPGSQGFTQRLTVLIGISLAHAQKLAIIRRHSNTSVPNFQAPKYSSYLGRV